MTVRLNGEPWKFLSAEFALRIDNGRRAYLTWVDAIRR
jgi:hypothetical protein